MRTTLKQILEKHPDWADREVVVYTEARGYEYVGESGSVYLDEENCESDENHKPIPEKPNPVVVFSGN